MKWQRKAKQTINTELDKSCKNVLKEVLKGQKEQAPNFGQAVLRGMQSFKEKVKFKLKSSNEGRNSTRTESWQ